MEQVREVNMGISWQTNNDLWFNFRFGRVISTVIDDVYSVLSDRNNQNLKILCNQILVLKPLLNDEKIATLKNLGHGPKEDIIISSKKEKFTTKGT